MAKLHPPDAGVLIAPGMKSAEVRFFGVMSNFEQAYGLLGYVRCNDGSREPGFERIAIYEDDRGVPTHAARQLPSGKWSSKCGRSYDVEHDLETDAGPGLDGEVAVYMRRPIL